MSDAQAGKPPKSVCQLETMVVPVLTYKQYSMKLCSAAEQASSHGPIFCGIRSKVCKAFSGFLWETLGLSAFPRLKARRARSNLQACHREWNCWLNFCSTLWTSQHRYFKIAFSIPYAALLSARYMKTLAASVLDHRHHMPEGAVIKVSCGP